MATSFTYTDENDIDFSAEEDILYALGGNDQISGINPVSVVIYGGGGDDDITYGSMPDGTPLNGTVELHGGLGNDQLDDGAGAGTSYLYGEEGNDILDSDRSTGPSFLYGGAGDDELWGLSGDVLIDKGAKDSAEGGSVLYGGKGHDYLFSKAGSDTFYGGGGKDTFDFGKKVESATILDFSQVDVINLEHIDARTKKKGNQSFVFIGKDAFNDKPGELKFSKDKLKADTNGDGRADIVIEVKGDNVTASDLHL